MLHAGLLETGHVPDSAKLKIQTQYLVGLEKKKNQKSKKTNRGMAQTAEWRDSIYV